MCSIGVDHCLYVLSQEDLLVLLVLVNFEQVRRRWFRPRNVWKDLKHFLHTFFGSSFLAISSIDSDIFYFSELS